LDQWVNRSLDSEDDDAVTVSLAVLEVMMVRNYVFTLVGDLLALDFWSLGFPFVLRFWGLES
jgi:hypothetical protein